MKNYVKDNFGVIPNILLYHENHRRKSEKIDIIRINRNLSLIPKHIVPQA